MKWLWLAMVIGSSGCVSTLALMRNGSGDIQRCEGRPSTVRDCIREFEVAGYRHVTAAEREEDRDYTKPVMRNGRKPRPTLTVSKGCTDAQRAEMAYAGVSESAMKSVCDE